MDELGGPEAFADAVRNRQRTSTTNGILKAEAVYRQAAMLAEEGVVDVSGLTDAVRERWVLVPGSKSGTSWDALLLVMGEDTVKADRMLRRFCAAALGTTESRVSAKRAHELVVGAAAELGVSARALDGAIWAYESGSSPRRTPPIRRVSPSARQTIIALATRVFTNSRIAGLSERSRGMHGHALVLRGRSWRNA